MKETAADLRALQHLLDQSYEAAGGHLLSIHTPERRLTAPEIATRLTGMSLLSLATSTTDGRPLSGPVDGIFYRGTFWFGSAPNSLRLQHIRQRPGVSATHLPGEQLGVTVHGDAFVVDLTLPEHRGFSDVCAAIYGEGWRNWGTDASYARISPRRMFVFSMAGD